MVGLVTGRRARNVEGRGVGWRRGGVDPSQGIFAYRPRSHCAEDGGLQPHTVNGMNSLGRNGPGAGVPACMRLEDVLEAATIGAYEPQEKDLSENRGKKQAAAGP